ncbi:MAG: 3-methyladenine DNA glycosylase [Balneola sp.]
MIIQHDIAFKEIFSEKEWKARKQTHEQKVDELIGEYLKARSAHKKQPVMDFLFEYYAFRPSALRRWSPGIGVGLEVTNPDNLPELSELKTENGIAFLNLELFPEKRIKSIRWILEMLQNTQDKKPMFGCFGMHEWAMVYKAEKPRHDQVPLRMEPEELAAFVESRPLVCTHFDAYRFFTPEAVPLNKFELSRQEFANTEQPGCIHSNMDLYKWAHKLYPWIGSDLILEAFELACEARTIDMMASPYDLMEHGLEPIKIETESGRLEYLKQQEAIFEKGKPVRKSLIEEIKRLLNV